MMTKELNTLSDFEKKVIKVCTEYASTVLYPEDRFDYKMSISYPFRREDKVQECQIRIARIPKDALEKEKDTSDLGDLITAELGTLTIEGNSIVSIKNGSDSSFTSTILDKLYTKEK